VTAATTVQEVELLEQRDRRPRPAHTPASCYTVRPTRRDSSPEDY
jgi:hypothetical protein